MTKGYFWQVLADTWAWPIIMFPLFGYHHNADIGWNTDLKRWLIPSRYYFNLMNISYEIRHCLIPSKDTDDQKILQSRCMRVFWPITFEVEFSQVWDWHRKKENCKICFSFVSALCKSIIIFPETSNKSYFWNV